MELLCHLSLCWLLVSALGLKFLQQIVREFTHVRVRIAQRLVQRGESVLWIPLREPYQGLRAMLGHRIVLRDLDNGLPHCRSLDIFQGFQCDRAQFGFLILERLP